MTLDARLLRVLTRWRAAHDRARARTPSAERLEGHDLGDLPGLGDRVWRLLESAQWAEARDLADEYRHLVADLPGLDAWEDFFDEATETADTALALGDG